MGANDSKQVPSGATDGLRSEERRKIENIYSRLSQNKKSPTKRKTVVSQQNLIDYLKTRSSNSNFCQIIGSAIAKSGCVTLAELKHFVDIVISANVDDNATAISTLAGSDSQMFLAETCSAFSDVLDKFSTAATWSCQPGDRLTLVQHLQKFRSDETIDQYSLARSFTNGNFLNILLSSLVRHMFDLRSENIEDADEQTFVELPICESKSRNATFMTLEQLFFITYHLPLSSKLRWRCLFNSNSDGASFTQLAKKIDKAGPCVIVVKTEAGDIFGAYCSQGFILGPDFMGNESTFLFTLKPQLNVFSPTGFNSNYAYLNQSQQTMPNGLGVGGQALPSRYFCLWIDDEFHTGESRPSSTTFKCPSLVTQPGEFGAFRVENIEAWGTAEPKQQSVAKSGGVLDTDETAEAILEMAGRKMHRKELPKD